MSNLDNDLVWEPKAVGLSVATEVNFVKTRCQFCSDETIVPQWEKPVVHHLIVTIDSDGHLHVHGPLNDGKIIKRMVDAIQQKSAAFTIGSK